MFVGLGQLAGAVAAYSRQSFHLHFPGTKKHGWGHRLYTDCIALHQKAAAAEENCCLIDVDSGGVTVYCTVLYCNV